ncbi:pentapeptide repeat-containing protein [Desmonostoc muscorum CCALA 125]|nr:pentapeptide repeat-containing protein [Desmonostoc muscorum CCALA 125]
MFYNKECYILKIQNNNFNLCIAMHNDFSRKNLQGRSFEGLNLEGANFSEADIRGANFTNANLRGANFNRAKAGVQNYRTTLMIVVSLIFSAIGGSIATIPAIWVSDYSLKIFFKHFNNFSIVHNIITGLFTAIMLIVLSIFIIKKNSGLVLVIISIVLAVTPALSVSFLTIYLVEIPNIEDLGTLLASIGGAIISMQIGFSVVIISVAVTSIIKGKLTGILTIICLLLSIIASIFLIAFIKTEAKVNITIESLFQGLLTGLLVSLVAAYLIYKIAESIATKDIKDSFFRDIVINLSSIGGTNFYAADLTDTDFTGATLKNTNFRKAILKRTRFYEAKKLDLAKIGDTILANLTVLNLLVTNNGRVNTYAGCNLKGANLRDADLKGANFKDADISEATFQGACLELVNLTLAQAVGTNFTSAQMTGACVEAWNIESTTKLDNVDCRFIFLLENPKPGTNDRERRPSSGEFQAGEFTKLFEEVLNTVDLIFSGGIDLRAFATAFKKVQVQNEDTELVIQSIESKGDGFIVVKLAVPVNANKQKIHSDFMQNYQLSLQAVEERYKAELEDKDGQIKFHRQQNLQLLEYFNYLANKPVEIQNKVENILMSEFSSSKYDQRSSNNQFVDLTFPVKSLLQAANPHRDRVILTNLATVPGYQ